MFRARELLLGTRLFALLSRLRPETQAPAAEFERRTEPEREGEMFAVPTTPAAP